MSFGLLSSILTFGFWFASWEIFPGELSTKEYIFGVVLCFIAAKVFASKSDSPEGDRLIMALLVPVGGFCMLFYGLYLKFGTEPEPLRLGDMEVVSVGSELLPTALMMGGACALIVCGYMYYVSRLQR